MQVNNILDVSFDMGKTWSQHRVTEILATTPLHQVATIEDHESPSPLRRVLSVATKLFSDFEAGNPVHAHIEGEHALIRRHV